MRYAADGIEVRWLSGGLWVAWGDGAVLLDAPPAAALLGAELGHLRAIVLTSGRIQAVGGLLGVLAATDRWRDPRMALPIRIPLGEERASLVAETWQRGWPQAFPVVLDAEAPGARFEVGPFEVRTVAVSTSEPDFREGTTRPIPGVGLQLRGPVKLAWVPGAAPGPVVEHLCRGCDLAVVEVGVLPWPRGAARLRPEDAIRAASDAKLLWCVGDDGEPLEVPVA